MEQTGWGVGRAGERALGSRRRSRRLAALRRLLAGFVIGLLMVLLGTVPARAGYSPTPLTSWTPTSGRVYAIARVGDTVIIGGSFTALWSPGGQTVTRNHLAAFDAHTGDLLAWNPDANGVVRALEVSDDSTLVYVGGAFTAIGGRAKARVAAVSTATGAVLSGFTANAAATVLALEVLGPTLYVGGYFTYAAGQSRSRIVAVDADTGSVRTSFTASADAAVRSILATPDGSALILAGEFTTLNGQPRGFLGAVDPTGALTAWQPPPPCASDVLPCYILDLAQDAETVYAAVAGPGGRVTAYTTSDGTIRWAAHGDGDVQAIDVSGGTVYAGGHFDVTFAGQPRAGIVALRAADGAVLPTFAPRVLNGLGVFAVLAGPDRLRIGGGFEILDGTGEQRYAEFPILQDTQPPTVPTQLRATAFADTSLTLAWQASQDDDAVSGYRIRRDGVLVATVIGTTWQDSSLTPATGYRYSVQAVDGAGNASPEAAVDLTTRPTLRQLVPAGATWRYLSDGSDQGVAWRGVGFDDSGWPSGPAQLGYGDGDEATRIEVNGLTYYFRRSFELTSPAQVQALRASLVRDDGAVVYLNGVEAWRSNMPAGAVTATTRAASTVGGADESTPLDQTLPTHLLVPGTNVVAVEVHNAWSSSSDISFDLALEAELGQVDDAVPPTAPTNLRATATTSTSVDLAWDTAADDVGVTGYRVLRDAVTATTTSATTWQDGGRTAGARHTYAVVAVDAAGNVSPPSQPLVVSVPQPPPPPAPAGPLVAMGATWRYQVGTVPASWQTPSFDDAGWTAGAGQLGFGDGDEATLLTRGSMTYYFRTEFAVADPAALGPLTLTLLRDDGAAVHVNGVEVLRSNLPAGPLTPATPASANVSGRAEGIAVTATMPSSVLVPGRNMIAVEVHQDSMWSSDVSFDLSLID